MGENGNGALLIAIVALVAVIGVLGLLALNAGQTATTAILASMNPGNSDAACRVKIVGAESDFGAIRVSGMEVGPCATPSGCCWLPSGCSTVPSEVTVVTVPMDAAQKICGAKGGGQCRSNGLCSPCSYIGETCCGATDPDC